MKKLLGIIFALFLICETSYAGTIDRYPFVVTTDTPQFTTSVAKYWRWLETRIKFEAKTTASIFHIIDSGEGSLYDTIIDHETISVTTDTVVYPGITGDTTEVLLRDTDELRVVITGTTNRPRVSIVGEEI